MARHVCRSVSLALAVAVAVAWVAPLTQAQGPHPIVKLAKKLAEPVNFPGFDDPKTTLQEALAYLTERYGLRFDVNEKAFQMELGGGGAAARAPRSGGNDAYVFVADDQAVPGGKSPLGDKGAAPGKGILPGDKGPSPGKGILPGKGAPPVAPAPNGPSDVMNTLVAETRPIPKLTGVRLETILKRILAHVPSPSGATYVLRRDGIEITTAEAKLAEFRVRSDHASDGQPGLDGPQVPQLELILVQAEFDKRPLDAALKELADTTDATVVLDGRAADKAKAVTATLINVPLDTAVEILANMSGLQVVSRDRVLYVTTKDNADAMQKQQRDRAGGMNIPMGGFGPQPGGLLGPIQPFGPGVGIPQLGGAK